LDPPTFIGIARRVSITRVIFNINPGNKNGVTNILKGERDIQPLRKQAIIRGAENKNMDASNSHKLSNN